MTTKLQLDCEDETWDEVKVFKIKNHCKDLNEAVNLLIKKGLKLGD